MKAAWHLVLAHLFAKVYLDHMTAKAGGTFSSSSHAVTFYNQFNHSNICKCNPVNLALSVSPNDTTRELADLSSVLSAVNTNQ